MWIALTIILGILLLIAIGNNTVLRQELDAPLDFTVADHAHLNRLMREVGE